MAEHDEQSAFFQWIDWNVESCPPLALFVAIPNGGHRHIAVAIKLRKEGVKKGYPDTFMAYPSNGFHGLFIEFKYGKNKPGEEQLEWHRRLREVGYKVCVCWNWVEATRETSRYLNRPQLLESDPSDSQLSLPVSETPRYEKETEVRAAYIAPPESAAKCRKSRKLAPV